MKLRKIISIMLTALIALSCVSGFAASTFSDVADDYWAKDYIEEMYSIGLITGYPDGTFGPAKAVSKWESLILAARVLGFKDEANKEYIEMASDEYMSTLSSYDVQNKEEICYLLYWGVLTEKDLPSYLADDKKHSPELRYEAAILLTKVMGGEYDALNQSSIVIDYDDASDIPTAAKPYVSYVTSYKVMQGTGDNKFDPLMQVSRAQMSTMMYNTMRAINLETKVVTVQSVVASKKEFTAYDAEGNSEKYTVLDSTLFRADGEEASLADLDANTLVKLNIQNGDIRLVEWDPDATEKTAEGKVVSVKTAGGGEITIAVVDKNGKTSNKTFKVVSTASILSDGDRVGLSDVKTNHYATVYYTGDGNVFKIVLETKATSVNGSFVEFGVDPNTVTIALSNGREETYHMLDGMGVIKNNRDASIYDIAKGDRVLLTLEYNKVKLITATSVDQTIEGSIKELVFGDHNTIEIKLSDSTTEKYNITENTIIYVDDVASNMYALRPGAQVKLNASSTNAAKIYSYAVVAPSQYVGTVKSVNSAYNLVTITNVETGLDQQVVIKGGCTIIDNTKSGITTLSKLKPGYQILVLGNMSSGAYVVHTLIVTN